MVPSQLFHSYVYTKKQHCGDNGFGAGCEEDEGKIGGLAQADANNLAYDVAGNDAFEGAGKDTNKKDLNGNAVGV